MQEKRGGQIRIGLVISIGAKQRLGVKFPVFIDGVQRHMLSLSWFSVSKAMLIC